MGLVVDHLVTTWTDLETPTEIFADLGMKPEYGGQHADGTTEMSMLCFQDGSYLELLTNVEGREPSRWAGGIDSGAGPYTWFTDAGDVTAHLQGVLSKDHYVAGPSRGGRETPDGRRIEWDQGVVGDEGVRSLLPFVIADRTPRRYRASTTESVDTAPVSGVGEVLLAVEDVDAAAQVFDDLYRFPSPDRYHESARGIELASFPGQPVTLVSPDGDGRARRGPAEDWVSDRLDAHGERPCGCLLRVRDLKTARHDFELSDPVEWPGGRVAWFDDDRVGRWLGVLEREDI